MLANSWLYQYYGYQNQPCGVLDPRCQKFFRRETTYQDAYQEYSYVDSQEMEYPGYHVSTYVPQKMSEDLNGLALHGCERTYPDRGPVDYSTHSPQSTISEERSPLHYDPSPEIVVNSNMYMYPHHGKREYYEQYPRVNYPAQEACTSTGVEVMEYPSPKRMRLASLTLDTDGMDRWNPSPPWSDTLKAPEYQRFSYNHVVQPDRTMVT
ncbi:uncharacterized protein [Choristoneura fumiferana]|uniref:uncharacterized protein n=1 Tax=Choristoneura fumiferana TaxID=7141 RepID=UPI003D15C263